MKLVIENIGKIEKATIDIDGITIIAGENNVGKSTVGKVLFAMLNDMNRWQETYTNTCSVRIAQYLRIKNTRLEDLCMKNTDAVRRRTSKVSVLVEKYAEDEKFVASIEDYQVAVSEEEELAAKKELITYLERYCKEYFQLYVKKNIEDFIQNNKDEIEKWIEAFFKNVKLIELDEMDIQKDVIVSSLRKIFRDQYRRISTSASRIVLTDEEDRDIEFIISDSEESLSLPIRIANQVFFIESPKIFDYLSDIKYGGNQKEYLRFLMRPNIFNERNNDKLPLTAVDESNELSEIEDVVQGLEETMGGRAEFLQKVGLEFRDKNIPETIHSINVSSGLKAVALLEYGLRVGAIRGGDILVLDEPEINLHPEWQVEYAKALVLLQKKFNLKIIITTHSPYFIRAIECFTDIFDTMDPLNVYKMSLRDSYAASIENVSYSEFGMTSLYEDLSAPLEELEDDLNRKYTN